MAKPDFSGKKIVVTGASSGIGRAGAIQLAAAGAQVMLVARREEELRLLQQEIMAAGGQALIYPTDLGDLDATAALGDTLVAEHGKIDVLINNAGRSIRRKLSESLDRFHDFERCMRLNYYAPVQLSLKLLGPMLEARDGQIINTSTWGTLLPSPRFAAYTASKCAMDGFAASVDAELSGQGIITTQLHFPIVRTAMIGPTKLYAKLPGMSPEAAGSWMVKAVDKRPARVAHTLTLLGGLNHYLTPSLSRRLTRWTGI